jgi:hypothetical protein
MTMFTTCEAEVWFDRRAPCELQFHQEVRETTVHCLETQADGRERAFDDADPVLGMEVPYPRQQLPQIGIGDPDWHVGPEQRTDAGTGSAAVLGREGEEAAMRKKDEGRLWIGRS